MNRPSLPPDFEGRTLISQATWTLNDVVLVPTIDKAGFLRAKILVGSKLYQVKVGSPYQEERGPVL